MCTELSVTGAPLVTGYCRLS